MVARHKEALVNETTIKYKPLRSDEVQKAIAADPEIKLLMKTMIQSFKEGTLLYRTKKVGEKRLELFVLISF